MKKFISLLITILSVHLLHSQSIGIGTTMPDSSAALEVSSVTQGMLVPRMTTAQRTSIANPATGLLVFDISTNSFWFKGSTVWIQLVDSSNAVVQTLGSNIYMGMNGNVGIGTSTPSTKLEVKTGPASPGISHFDQNVRMSTITTATSGVLATTTNHALQLNANNGLNQFTIGPNGNIGIGTAFPGAMLEIIRGSATQGSLAVQGSTFHSYFNQSTNEHTTINGGKSNSHVLLNALPGLGFVGIGTASPLQKLHVEGNTYVNGNLGIGMSAPAFPLNFAAAQGNKISLSGNSGAHYGFGVGANMMQLYTPNNTSAIGFGYGQSTAFTENMRLTGDGRLGIGTNAPSQKLDVNGNVNISGGLAVGLGVVIGGALAVGGAASFGGAVGVGTTTPDPSSILDLNSTTKGFLMPRMSTQQREAIENPAEGLTVYDNTTNSPWYRTENEWEEMEPEETSMDTFDHEVFRNGEDMIYMGLTDSVGVGISIPEYKLHVQTDSNRFGIAHTDEQIEIATYISGTAGGSIGTVTNHPFSIYAGSDEGQLTVLPEGHVYIRQKLGINNTTPNAPLQFSNADQVKKIVLHERNDNEYNFSGFGFDNDALRYQADSLSDHVFYRGGETNSIELLRIKGEDGRIGIGTASPMNKLDVAEIPREVFHPHPSNLAMYVSGDNNGSNLVEFRNGDATQGIGFGQNTISAAGSNVSQDLILASKGSAGSLQLKTNNQQRVFISGTGNVGIGMTTPNAPLQFPNNLVNRKIVLWESSNNDHQFYGLGINSFTLRYQVSNTADNHVFYAATSASTSNELMRISGNGNVGIGINLPLASLEVARGTGSAGTAMFRGTINASHFNYSTDEHTYIRGGKSTSNVILNDLGTGNVAIGTAIPFQKLHVAGNVYISQNAGIGVISPDNRLDVHAGGENRSGTHVTGRPLYVTGSISDASNGIEFRHANGTQGIGFGFNTIYAAGSNVDQNLGMAAKGAGGALVYSTNGAERIRITGSGNIGISNSNPPDRVTIGAYNLGNTYLQVNTQGGNLYKAGIKLRHHSDAYGWTVESDETTGLFHIRRHVNDATGINAVTVNGYSGDVGIGNSAPHAPLQFANTEQNRKIVLHEFANNDHQFSGIGYNTGAMRYQTANEEFDHVFYSAVSNSSSTELMRIKGLGSVDIPGTLEIGYTVQQTSVNVPVSSTGQYSCDCPAGTKALGGGWTGAFLDTIESRPSENGALWIVTTINHDPISQHTLYIWAICARLGN